MIYLFIKTVDRFPTLKRLYYSNCLFYCAIKTHNVLTNKKPPLYAEQMLCGVNYSFLHFQLLHPKQHRVHKRGVEKSADRLEWVEMSVEVDLRQTNSRKSEREFGSGTDKKTEA